MSDINMRILLQAVGASSVVSAIQSIGQSLGSGGLSGALLGVGTAVAGAAVAIGTASVQAAGDFQNAMLQNVAHAGLAKDQVDNVNKALLEMGPAVGKGPTELAQALYPVLSGLSGITDQSAKTQLALTELKLAAQSTAGTTVDTTTVTNAATAAFNAFGLQTNNSATNVSRMNGLFDVMNATITAGNMQWGNYATKVGDLASKAAQSHVAFTEANAALAVFTNSGQSVDLAGTHLGALFQSLALDTDKFATRAKKLNETFDVSKFQSLDLAGKLKYLDDMTGHDPGKLKAILGNKTLTSTFEVLKDHIGDYQNTLKSLDQAQGTTAKAFETASSGYNFRVQQMGAAFDSLKIAIGTQLLPVLSQLLGWITPLITGFANWVTESHVVENSVQTLGVWITNLKNFLAPLGPLLGQVTSWLGTANSAVISNKNFWSQLGQTLQGIGNFLSTTFTPAWQQLVNVFQTRMIPSWNDLMNTIRPILPELQKFGMIVGIVFLTLFSLITGIIAGIIGALGGFLSGMAIWFAGVIKAWTGLVQTISGVIAFIVDLVTGRFDKLGADLGIIWGGIIKMFQGIWDSITGLFVAAINSIIGLVNGFVAGVLGPINTVLSAAHLATISVGQIPLIAGPAHTAAPSLPGYQSPALSKSGTPNAPTDQATAMLNAMQQQAAQMQQQAQQQNMSQLLAAPALSPSSADGISNTIKSTSAASDAKKAAAAAKKLDAADARSAKLATTLQNALDKSSSTQVQALVNQSKAAEAAGKTSMASFYAQQAASQAAKDQAAAKKDQAKAVKDAKAAALAQTKMDKFNLVAAGQGGALSPNSTIMTPFASSIAGYPVSSAGSNAPAQQQTVFNITINGLVGDKSTIVDYIMQQISRQLRSSGVLYPTTSGGRAI